MRLIDADAFDKALSDAQDKCKKSGGNFRYGFLSSVRANMLKQPTVDAAPVIRCKDCINWDTDWTTHQPDHYCPAIDQFTSAGFYCGYAEKKELEEQHDD